MKCSMSWLREWVNPSLSNEALCEKLTMGGLEVESLEQDGDDFVIDVSITPNRGDCLSVRGLAREVAALTGVSFNPAHAVQAAQQVEKIPAFAGMTSLAGMTSFPVTLHAPQSCPRYVGRIIRHVKADATTPEYISERLRKAGVRVISPIVDVTNYVMLQLGQPMHAFDLATIDSEIQVRTSKKDEKISLLDGTEKTLDNETLVIADKHKPLAIAGVMGGLDSSVTTNTKDILLESAWFAPKTVARARQFYNLSSESASRFERGVDYTIQQEAIECATKLILKICGGEAGEIFEAVSEKDLPKPVVIEFPHKMIKDVLGIDCYPREGVALPMTSSKDGVSQIPVPPYRFDLAIPEDIVEEVARLYGYDKIPTHTIRANLETNPATKTANVMDKIRQCLINDGFHEVISYSFVDKKLQQLLDPGVSPHELVNPITAEMDVMRTNLWPGLVNALLYNKSRQQHRVRLFESGLSFLPQANEIKQEPRLSGLMSGLSLPEQWGMPKREVDFYDLKGCIERVLETTLSLNDITWQPETHSALHPGQSAGIYFQGKKIGLLGALSPAVTQALDMKDQAKILVFELDLAPLLTLQRIRAEEVSKFPEIRRDIALMLNASVPAQAIQDTIRSVAGDWLKDVFIFDVYQGKGISPGLKSVALGMVLQHPARTLVDDEVNALMERVTAALKGQLGAELRS